MVGNIRQPLGSAVGHQSITEMQTLALAIQQIGVNVMAIQQQLYDTTRAVNELRAGFMDPGKVGSFKSNSYGSHVINQLIKLEADLSTLRALVTNRL